MLNLGNHIDYYVNEFSRLIVENKTPSSKETAFYDFIKEIKKSNFLILEFLLYRNLKNKTINANSSLAEEYVKDNLKKFDEFSIKDMDNSHILLENFTIENEVNNNINSSIHNLLKEYLTPLKNRDLHTYSISLWKVMEHLKEEKETSNETTLINEDIKYPTEVIIERTNDIFNKKYYSLNEDDKNWIKIFDQTISENVKKDILDKFKSNAKSFLNENKIDDYQIVDEAIKKIESIELDSDDFEDRFFEIHYLIS